MAKFLELPLASGRATVMVNMDTVTTMRRLPPSQETTFSNAMPERTALRFIGDGPDSMPLEVLPSPESIIFAMEARANG